MFSVKMEKLLENLASHYMPYAGHGPIDVRYAEEYDEGHIPGAKLIPLFELRNRISELDKKLKYVVYCHGGSRGSGCTGTDTKPV